MIIYYNQYRHDEPELGHHFEIIKSLVAGDENLAQINVGQTRNLQLK